MIRWVRKRLRRRSRIPDVLRVDLASVAANVKR
jgi:hypothetical protein